MVFHSSLSTLHSSLAFMEPEIARRCLTCGAAVRGQARFCPQCGQDMGAAPTLNRRPVSQPDEQPQTHSGRLVDEAERVARALSDSVPPIAAAVVSAPAANDGPHSDAPQPREPAESPRTGGMRARAGERVERLREASVVVLDEAQDDPALRFVLVAVLLFVVFLLILLFSHILR